MFVERFPRKEKKKFQRFFFIILGENLACTFFFFTKDDLKDFFLIILGGKKKSARQPGVRFFLEKIGKSVQSSDLIKNIHLVFFFYQQHTNPYDAPE